MKINKSVSTRFWKISISGLLIGLFLLPAVGFAQIKRVWALDDGEKIKKEDITNSLATDKNNAVWKNNSVNIFGARNEIVAFQLMIQADVSGATNVNVVISDLKNGSSVIPGSATGPADPFDYRGRNVELFTEHYLNITKRSPPAWFFKESATPSAYYMGWVPDCLIPFSAPAGKGGAPFSIEGNNNQGVWVDIFIPKNAAAGTYKGQTIVSVSDKVFATIPISLKVYDFTLPDTTHIYTMFGFSSVARRHGVTDGSPEFRQLDTRYLQMAHRHRMNLMKRPNSLSDLETNYKTLLTGELYTPANGYEGPGEKVGNNTFCIGYNGSFPLEYGGSFKNATEASWWAGSDAWKTWFVQNAPHVQLNKYLFPDEPGSKGPTGKKGTGSMDTIRIQAKWSHSNPGIGKEIPCLVTMSIRQQLMGYVDFWQMSGSGALGALPEDVASVRAHGNLIGVYNGYRPGLGAVVSDADATDFRVIPWIVWKYKLDQYFYWSTNFWGRINVFVNPFTFENRINGDGTFFYPGQDAQFPEESRNLAGPLSSIRMKNWRRGAQDLEYLWLAKNAGLENKAKTIVDACVPVALWEAKEQKDVSWSGRGYKFDLYRKQLAELLSTSSTKSK
jgi:hypothetical protein